MSSRDEEKKRSWLIDRAPQQAKQPDPYGGDPYQGLGKRTRTEEANFNPNLPAEESPFTVMRRERKKREAKKANAPTIQMPDDFVGHSAPQKQGQNSAIEMPDEYVVDAGGEYVNQGPLCERPDPEGICHLSPTQRRGLIAQFNLHISMAATAYHAAVGNVRIDELLKKAPQIGLAAELIIGALGVMAGGLLGLAATRGLQYLNAGSGLKDAELLAVLAQQRDVVRGFINEGIAVGKARVKPLFAGNTPASQIKSTFLLKLQNEINPTFDAINTNVLDKGDDFALVIASQLFDPNVFTVDACTKHVQDVLKRVEDQHIDEIGPLAVGPVTDAGTTEVVRFQSWGKHRLGTVRFHEAKKMGRGYGDDWYTPSGTHFLSWIDDDLSEFATSAQAASNGGMKTIDVTMGHTFGGDVEAWVESTRRGKA